MQLGADAHERRIFGAHIVLGLLLVPLWAVAIDIAPLLFVGGLLTVPFFTFVWSLLQPPTHWPDEACTHAYAALHWHGFVFQSQPGRVLWTGNADLAQEILRRPLPLPAGGDDLDWRVEPAPPDRQRWTDAANTALQALVYGMASTTSLFLLLVFGTFAAEAAQTGDIRSLILGAVLLFTILIVSVVVSLFVLIPYGIAFAILARVWNLSPRTRSLRWTGTNIVTENGSFALDADDVRITLDRDLFGSILRLRSTDQSLVVRAEHALLAPLAEALMTRSFTGSEHRAHVRAALRAGISK